MTRWLFVLALLLPLALFSGPATAVEPDEVLEDPVLEARARELSKIIRCVVCQNESIDSSNAGLAKDLRVLVRERLTAGASDQDVLDYLVARYGDFVLLRPPIKPVTYLLWFGPAIILLLGGTGAILYLRRRARATGAADLMPEERARLDRLLKEAEAGEREPS